MDQNSTPKLYTYCIPYDDGAAPNPFWGICTLVICKPVIRRIAKKGDWVIGTGSKKSPIGNISKHVVYAMEITGKMTLEEYDKFCQKQYPNKIPDWGSNDYRRRFGDCIYDFSKSGSPKMRKGVHNEGNRKRDLDGKCALLSGHFYYFGDCPIKLPDSLQVIIKKGQGHKSKSNAPYIGKFISWIKERGFKPNRLYGNPQLKRKILENVEYVSKCAKYRQKEAEIDEEIGTKCEWMGCNFK